MTTQPATIPSPTIAELAAEARRNADNARRFAQRATLQTNELHDIAVDHPLDPFPAAIATAAQTLADYAAKFADYARHNANQATSAHPATVAQANADAIAQSMRAAQWSDMVNTLHALQSSAVSLARLPRHA